jgi:hypothetical protein
VNKPASRALDARLYDIQIRSLRSAIEHMSLIDLTELHAEAMIHGTDRDRAMIEGIIALLAGIKPNQPS